ncbi:ATP-binding protein [Pseudomonas nitroreducens]|uniref:ATP-binding protein n=1 Tax=Pseudomonas nitroreducens TaxID=46680 RepID=UPI0018755DE9|nr:ATP-binding protein [Pseudomonas nitritireducens]
MADELDKKGSINAHPTKAFFVDMLVKDIPLEQAVLDLVDNCIDGAKRLAQSLPASATPYQGRKVEITFDKEEFRIVDNCGGFSTDIARNYAFRFGRPKEAQQTSHSIGQFGVGMKRALFKFGKHFSVLSATQAEEWAIDVNVPEWESDEENWTFPWSEFSSEVISTESPGTEIVVTDLRSEVAFRFSTSLFSNSIIGLIKSKHRQFIAEGLQVFVNGTRIDATNIYLLMTDKLKPGKDAFEFDLGEAKVSVSIIVGVGLSSPREAGWYVICNGRVVLEADRRNVTGWGVLEEEAGRTMMPAFHNQFARFRGIVSFDSEDSSKVPWNTTKTDVDLDSVVWIKTFHRMLEMMRPVIDFLNELDSDIDEFTREKSPLLDHVSKAASARPESITNKSDFIAPARGSIEKGPKYVKIQYSRKLEDVQFLQDALGAPSAKAVGEASFDLILKRHKE